MKRISEFVKAWLFQPVLRPDRISDVLSEIGEIRKRRILIKRAFLRLLNSASHSFSGEVDALTARNFSFCFFFWKKRKRMNFFAWFAWLSALKWTSARIGGVCTVTDVRYVFPPFFYLIILLNINEPEQTEKILGFLPGL